MIYLQEVVLDRDLKLQQGTNDLLKHEKVYMDMTNKYNQRKLILKLVFS